MADITVTSNGVRIPFTPDYFGAMRETALAAVSDADLRARYAEDGYVLLRGFLPAASVREVRETYFDMYESACTEGTLPPHGMKGHPAHAFVRSQIFRQFVEQPVFQALARRLTGTDIAPIRRTPLRHFAAGSKVASRAHIDGTYIDGNPTDVVTVWMPFGDCAIHGGSLMYLEGSHRESDLLSKVRGNAPMDRATDARPITHDLKWLSETTGRRWLGADFAAGDVVVHSPTIVHATLDAAAGERLSADIRFRRVDGPQDPRWDNDWSSDDGY